MCGFQCTTPFDSAHNGQYLGPCDLSNWPFANPREDVTLEEPNQPFAVAYCPGWGMLGKPLPRHYLETVNCAVGVSGLLRFPVFARIDSVGQELTRFVPSVTGVLEAHIGINTQRQPLFLAVEAVFQTPPFAACRRDFQIQPTLIEELFGSLAGHGVRILVSVRVIVRGNSI